MTLHRYLRSRRIGCAIAVVVAGLLAAFLWQQIGARYRSTDHFETTVAAASNPFLPAGETDRGWPFVRGPDFDGHSAEIHLADSWPQDGPPVLWVRGLGQGFSGFVAARGRVYTQYQDIGGQYVVCLAADSGKTVWQYRYDWPFEMAGMYPGPRATPTLAHGRVYFAGPDGTVGCLSQAGKLQWSVNLKEKYDGQGTGFGCACSPTVVGERFLVPVGGRGASLVALDCSDGSVVWTAGSDPASYTPALPIMRAGRRQVIGYLQNSLVAHDFDSGKLLWRIEFSDGYDEHAAWPIYQEPYLWISGPFQTGSQLLELPEQPGESYRQVWQSRIMSNDVASSVLVDGCIYGFDLRDIQTKLHRPSKGSFRCIELLSGEERWSNGDPKQRRDPQDESLVGHASVIAADGKLIMFNDTGDLVLALATPERYEQLARSAVLSGEICWTAPALHRGCVFLRNHTRAMCVYVGEPELLDANLAAAAAAAGEIPNSDYLDLAVVLGVEPEYAFDVPSARWLRWWFVFSTAILGIAMILAGGAATVIPNCRLPWSRSRWLLLAVAFILGCAGTTALSLWRGEFVFTWPVALFVAFQAGDLPVAFRWAKNRGKSLAWMACGIDLPRGLRRLFSPLPPFELGLGMGFLIRLRRRTAFGATLQMAARSLQASSLLGMLSDDRFLFSVLLERSCTTRAEIPNSRTLKLRSFADFFVGPQTGLARPSAAT